MDSGATDNATALQLALNANAGYGPVTIVNTGGYAKVGATLIAPANSRIILQGNPDIRWTSVTTGPTINASLQSAGIWPQGSSFRN
jgi:hypothetical protein